MHFLPSYLFFLCGVSACQAAVLTLYQSGGQNITTDLDNPTVLLSYLNTSRTTVFFTHGADGNIGGRYITTMASTCMPDHNKVLLDWTKEAKILFDIAFLSYVTYNAPSAEKIGYEFGECLVKLIKNGLKTVDFFLMGFSLGAHVMGAAGRRAIQLGYTLDRIIGMDPSGALYTKYFPVFPSLDSTCAKYVFKVCTDPDGYGDSKPNCDVNVFPNYNTYTMQPGCTEKANFVDINENSTCNHDWSWRLICASKDNPNLLKAQGAADGQAWKNGLGNGLVAFITVENQPGILGSFYLKTVVTYPYGLGDAGMNP